ncbi:putative RNA methyltransferase [Waddlia chondrophila 2032/99]|uniref:Ribosomal RNA small subunit methyltransferase E n=2 Tax=Waddlia chondrophila TaxID=71667 RepID=D6YVI7_WADCW|nr:RsmE family RNA methyltransferase [Waddlia chondrophila]ADI38148.1 putative RNA methyltransferase [Waddlia chondrophila WSU 86-1044]CCB91159.1 putative RNA methyltransferase [Waddlia chondrophila 2032/99]
MPVDRFYLDSPLELDSRIAIGGQELHHLAHVSRARAGEEVELINGKGTLAVAEVLEIKKNEASLLIHSTISEKPSAFPIIIAQAIPRPNRLDTIVEKCTELGMDELRLFPGKLSEKKDLKESQLARLTKIAISAAKQSGRLFIPSITFYPPISKWPPSDIPLYFGDLSDNAPLFFKRWNTSPPKQGIAFVIGPESGLHEEEVLQLEKLHAIGVKLHQNILRTDTAPLTALSLIAHFRMCRL